MNYNNINLIYLLMLLQKSLFNNKFNLMMHLFLTNQLAKFYAINQQLLFANSTPLMVSQYAEITTLLIKKLPLLTYKIINLNRRYFIFNNYSFHFKFKFTRFYSNILNNSWQNLNNFKSNNVISKSSKNLTNLFIFKTKTNIFLKNWSYITGSGVSPYSWELFSQKKSFRKALSFFYIKNNFFYNNIFNKSSYRNEILPSSFHKKMFINNFFYLKNLNINYSSLLLLLKLNTATPLKNTYNWFFSKPYLYLNNYDSLRPSIVYQNLQTIQIFKSYSRFFGVFKKNTFRKAKYFLDISFRTSSFVNSFFNSNHLNNPYNPFNFYKPFTSFRSNSPLMSLKSHIIPKKNFLIGNSHTESLLKPISLINSSFKMKLLKRNKLPISFVSIINQKNDIITRFNNFNNLRLTKKLKKKLFWFILNETAVYFEKPILFWNKQKVDSNAISRNRMFNYFCKKITVHMLPLFKKNSNRFFYLKRLTPSLILVNKPFNYSEFKESNIFSNSPKLAFMTKEKNNFSSNKYGFLFIFDSFSSFFNKSKNSYNLKKIIYSFSNKNDLTRYILKRYTRNLTTLNFNPMNAGNNFVNSQNLLTSWGENTFYELKKQNEICTLINNNFFNSTNWSFYQNQINAVKHNMGDDFNFNIKRIRFKPGYMSLWREVRSVIKNSLSLNFKYQHKLTNYLSKYNKFVKFKTFLFSEMQISNVLLRSRLFNDSTLCLLFIKNSLIYVNGQVCSNQNFQLYLGDFIQLVVSLKYYILYRWCLNLSLKKKNRLKKILRRKMSFNHDLGEKKRSNVTPKWVLSNKNLIDDVAKYIEVDYFSLSLIVLYEPFLWSDLNPYNLIDQKFGVINLYNWKYIT